MRATPVSPASTPPPPSAPSNLHAFLFRVDEPISHSYPRTPAFAWNPVSAATSYEFELATSNNFADATTVYSMAKLSSPTVSVPMQLPWMTGSPYALWTHVRGTRVAAAATARPRFLQLPLVAWKPALGTTKYQVELWRARYPWVAARKQETYATSIVLDLTKKDLGTWFHRVRGVNPGLPKNAQTMTWSAPVELRITGDQFVVVSK